MKSQYQIDSFKGFDFDKKTACPEKKKGGDAALADYGSSNSPPSLKSGV